MTQEWQQPPEQHNKTLGEFPVFVKYADITIGQTFVVSPQYASMLLAVRHDVYQAKLQYNVNPDDPVKSACREAYLRGQLELINKIFSHTATTEVSSR